MEKPTDYETAKRRATAKYGFYTHALVFGAVMLLLMIINITTSSDALWFIWPLMGWGLAVALHAARVFLMPDRNEIIDAMTEREMHRHEAE